MDSVDELIMRSFQAVDKESKGGTLGTKFMEMLERKKEQQQVSTLDDLDEDFVRKVQFLAECEKQKDLAWFDYVSWRTLTVNFQDLFERTIDPLFSSSGIYFQYSKWQANIEALMRKSEFDAVVLVCQDGDCFQFVAMASNSTNYNWMSVSAFRKLSMDYNKRLLISMANSERGVVIRHIERLVQEGVFKDDSKD